MERLNAAGEVEATYDSISHASRETGIRRLNINSVCTGKKPSPTAGGFYWRYAQEPQ